MHRMSALARGLQMTVTAALLAGSVALPIGLERAHAATSAQMTIKCFGTKVRYQVSCWTWGNNFASGENVHLRYTVTHFTMPKQNSKRPSEGFIRTVKTNSVGTFTRTPRITFMVSKAHTSFSVAVTGLGSLKDHGATSLASIGT